MMNLVREALYRALTSPKGDSLAALRIAKNLGRRLNTTLGRPLAPGEELTKRAEACRRLAELRAAAPAPRAPSNAHAVRAPVLVYHEAGSNTRELTRIEELLASKDVSWKRLDLANDEATLDFVMRRTGCERDDLPVVFVGDHAVGAYEALVRANVSGELDRLLVGKPPDAGSADTRLGAANA